MSLRETLSRTSVVFGFAILLNSITTVVLLVNLYGDSYTKGHTHSMHQSTLSEKVSR